MTSTLQNMNQLVVHYTKCLWPFNSIYATYELKLWPYTTNGYTRHKNDCLYFHILKMEFRLTSGCFQDTLKLVLPHLSKTSETSMIPASLSVIKALQMDAKDGEGQSEEQGCSKRGEREEKGWLCGCAFIYRNIFNLLLFSRYPIYTLPPTASSYSI